MRAAVVRSTPPCSLCLPPRRTNELCGTRLLPGTGSGLSTRTRLGAGQVVVSRTTLQVGAAFARRCCSPARGRKLDDRGELGDFCGGTGLTWILRVQRSPVTRTTPRTARSRLFLAKSELKRRAPSGQPPSASAVVTLICSLTLVLFPASQRGVLSWLSRQALQLVRPGRFGPLR